MYYKNKHLREMLHKGSAMFKPTLRSSADSDLIVVSSFSICLCFSSVLSSSITLKRMLQNIIRL